VVVVMPPLLPLLVPPPVLAVPVLELPVLAVLVVVVTVPALVPVVPVLVTLELPVVGPPLLMVPVSVPPIGGTGSVGSLQATSGSTSTNANKVVNKPAPRIFIVFKYEATSAECNGRMGRPKRNDPSNSH